MARKMWGRREEWRVSERGESRRGWGASGRGGLGCQSLAVRVRGGGKSLLLRGLRVGELRIYSRCFQRYRPTSTVRLRVQAHLMELPLPPPLHFRLLLHPRTRSRTPPRSDWGHRFSFFGRVFASLLPHYLSSLLASHMESSLIFGGFPSSFFSFLLLSPSHIRS